MEALLALQKFIADEYSAKLGLELLEVPSGQVSRVAAPTWQWQSPDLSAAGAKNATGALLLDEEIGLCLFVQIFSGGTDLRSQLAKALQLRSALRPRRQTILEDVDELGEWSVAFLWIAEPDFFEKWIGVVGDTQQTSHFEEVSADVLVNSALNWSESCRTHGTPRLLFNVRAALRRREVDDTAQWLGADLAIGKRLRKIPMALPASLSKYSTELSSAIEHGITSAAGRSFIEFPQVPKELRQVSMRNFRNISDLVLELRDTIEPVAVNVIQGPNGTGKSSISEAMAIAVSGVSSRYLDFLADSNEPTLGKADRYIKRYLSPMTQVNLEPKLGLNGEPESIRLAEVKDAEQCYSTLSGSFLSQSWSENLLRIKAAELGAQIAGNFSSIVENVIEFVEKRQAEAEGERAAFNREWGLRANVSRDETAKTKISGAVLASTMPLPRSTLSWITTAAAINWKFKTDFQTCLVRWNQWDSESQGREKELGSAENQSSIQAAMQRHLESHNALSRLASDLVSAVKETRAVALELAPTLLNDVQAWCSWLDRRDDLVVTTASVDVRGEVNGLQSQLDELTRTGRQLSERVKQIDAVIAFTREHWAGDHPNTCPVCASDVSKKNGIVSALSDVKSSSENELHAARTAYVSTKAKLDEALGRLRELDSHLPPFQGEHFSRLRTAIDSVIGTDGSFDRLDQQNVRANVFATLEFLESSAMAAPPYRSEDEVRRAADHGSQRLWDAFQKFSQVSEAPEAWKSILAQITDELTATIREHLPGTIQALWWEIARNIMPAPWQYPGRIEFQIDQKRSQAEAKVVVKGTTHSPLAAHILNGAELHNLGLAWFFTRYLTFGRFVHSFMVMDDPAHQMDQPTFRDFCRLLAVLVRLHSSQKTSLTLVLFLHQDDRAMDAARFMNGTLHLLRWHSGSARIEDKYKMRVSPVLPVTPYRLLRVV